MRLIALALAWTATLAVPAPALAALSAADEADIARVELYLNRIQSARAKFIQIAPNGGLSEGQFLLQRPGRLRFEYEPPSPLLIVGDGEWIIFYDSELDDVSRVAIERTPVSVILEDEVRLDGRIGVAQIERRPGVLQLVLQDRENPDEGAVTLVFSDKPLQLRQWLVRDTQGQTTTVYFSDMELNPALDPKLFVFVDPNPFRETDKR